MKSTGPSAGGTFQPLRHRSGTMRDRLHGYTKRTLGAGGSVTEAVSSVVIILIMSWVVAHSSKFVTQSWKLLLSSE
jgi:MOB kinase activator 1